MYAVHKTTHHCQLKVVVVCGRILRLRMLIRCQPMVTMKIGAREMAEQNKTLVNNKPSARIDSRADIERSKRRSSCSIRMNGEDDDARHRREEEERRAKRKVCESLSAKRKRDG